MAYISGLERTAITGESSI